MAQCSARSASTVLEIKVIVTVTWVATCCINFTMCQLHTDFPDNTLGQ